MNITLPLLNKPHVRFASQDKERYNQREKQLIDSLLQSQVNPEGSAEYYQSGKVGAALDSVLEGARKVGDLFHYDDERVKNLRDAIRAALNPNLTREQACQALITVLRKSDVLIRTTGEFPGFLKRRTGRAVLDVLTYTAEPHQPFAYVNQVISDPSSLNVTPYLLTALKDHPAVAIVPQTLLKTLVKSPGKTLGPNAYFNAQWNSRLQPLSVQESYKHRRLLVYMMLNFIQRASHEMLVLTRISGLLRQSQFTTGRLLSTEETLALRNVLARLQEGIPEADFWAKIILKPPHSRLTSEINSNVTLPAISQTDQSKLLIHISQDIKTLKHSSKAALMVLKQALTPHIKSTLEEPIDKKTEADLKAKFFLENVMAHLEESTTGTHFYGIESIFNHIPFPQEGPSLKKLVVNQMLDLLEPAKDQAEFKNTKTYRLPFARLIEKIGMTNEQRERYQRICKDLGITTLSEGEKGYDSVNGPALERRLDESVIGLKDVKQSLSEQWQAFCKSFTPAGKRTKPYPIAYLDGANGTGKTSTFQRVGMELHTDMFKQMGNSAFDYWYGDRSEYEQDFGIVKLELEAGFQSGWTAQELQNGALKDFMINHVNILQNKLRHNTQPLILIFDEMSKIDSCISDPEAAKMVFDAISGMILNLATTGRYTVPGTDNISVTLPEQAIIGLTGNYSVNVKQLNELEELPTDSYSLKQGIFQYPGWQGNGSNKKTDGERLADLLKNKTFITGTFDNENVSKLVDALIQQYLPYVTALKSARVSFTNLDDLQRYYMNRSAKLITNGQEPLCGRDIAKEIKSELFENLAIRRAIPGTTFKIHFNPEQTERNNKLVFEIREIPPHSSLKVFG